MHWRLPANSKAVVPAAARRERLQQPQRVIQAPNYSMTWTCFILAGFAEARSKFQLFTLLGQ